MIEMVLLGTGGMMPLPERWLSSLLVRANGTVLLFDCGEGTQVAWREVGWGFRALGAICLSHAHADHVAGLPGLLHTVANAGRTEPVTVFGPQGIARVVEGLRTIAPYLPYQVDVRELSSGAEFELARDLKGWCAAGEHGLPVLAYRVEQERRPAFLPERARELGIPLPHWRTLQDGEAVAWEGGTAAPSEVLGPPRAGLAIAYVTDTRPTAALVDLARGVDLLVCEGTYGSDEDQAKAVAHQHMTFREAARLAREAGVKRLWLTHFSPAVSDPTEFAQNATDVFATTTIGVDGLNERLVFADLK